MHIASFFAGIFAALSSIFIHNPHVSTTTLDQTPAVTITTPTEKEYGRGVLTTSDSQEGKYLNAKVTTSAKVASTSKSTDPLLGLGSDKYAGGILPLGDNKYTLTGAKKGYVYICNRAQDGGGAEQNGPWIMTNTWNSKTKVNVQGATKWPNATYDMTVTGSTRTITSNGLPTVGTTGTYPVSSSDPAAAYDRNPNSVQVQSYTFNLPAHPTFASAPQCIYGEVGIMTNGIPLNDGFDALYRDAAAHEVQDSCDGHPHQGGIYHYHSLSSCIPNATVTNIIGWAFDGFPITGPVISDHTYLTSSDLDECHGITSDIMLDGKMTRSYHYVMTYDFPYSISCFKGKSYEPKPGQNGGSSTSGTLNSTFEVQSHDPAPTNQGMPTPPAQAINACSGSYSGASCSFMTPNGQLSGTCRIPPGQTSYACVPNQ